MGVGEDRWEAGGRNVEEGWGAGLGGRNGMEMSRHLQQPSWILTCVLTLAAS
jgi:hypothetical protein